MDKLLTRQGRIRFAAIVSVCALLLVVPLICFNLKEQTETARMIGNIGLSIVWFSLILVMLYLQNSMPTALELVEAAEAQREEFRSSAKAWASVRSKRLEFREMSLWEKFLQVMYILSGVGFIIYAALDFTHYLSPMKIRAINGAITVVPNWGTGAVAVLIGFVCFLLASLLRIRFYDKWEERFKELLGEVEDEFGE